MLFPISVLANFLPVYVPTTQAPACHCSNSSIMKKNARISLEEGKARYVVVSARLAWLSSSWSLLTMPRQNTGCHTMLQLTVGPPPVTLNVTVLLLSKRGTLDAGYRRHDCGPTPSPLQEKSSQTFLESRISGRSNYAHTGPDSMK